MSHSHTKPDWQALAETALARFQAYNRASFRDDTAPEYEGDEFERFVESRSVSSEHGRVVPRAIPNHGSKRTDRGRLLKTTGWSNKASSRDLLLLFRLCATFGNQARVSSTLDSGGITLIETGDVAPQRVAEMLEAAFLPAEAKIATDLMPRKTSGIFGMLTIVFCRTDDKSELCQQTERMIAALEQPLPLIILAASFTRLPHKVLKCLPPPLRLEKFSTDILIALLSETHAPNHTEQMTLRNAFLQHAGEVSWPALATALREKDAISAARKLNELITTEAQSGPTLANIEGFGAAEQTARQMVSDLEDWSAGNLAWADVQRSVLFHGAPGTGKSFLAAAMGNSAGVQLIRGSFARWQSAGHLGDMLRSMSTTFLEAAQARPAILVIDEVDALGDRNDPDPHSRSYRHQVINGFLAEMDGLKTLEGLMVVGTCNFPERIDAAALRPGRFDVIVEVPLPGNVAIRRMLRDGLGCHVPEIDLTRLTSAAAGASSADIDGALRVARTHARQMGRAVVPVDLLTQFGFEDRNPALDSRIAVHECGHAIVFKYLGLGRVRRLAITRDGGGAWLHSTPQQGLISDWESQITYILAGRAAERLIFGAATAGAGGGETSDLAQATAQAVLIDTKLGLGAEGLVWLDPDRSLYLQDPENAARVRSRLDKAESRALVVLAQNEPLLRKMADALNQARMLEDDALKNWLDQITIQPNGLATPQTNSVG